LNKIKEKLKNCNVYKHLYTLSVVVVGLIIIVGVVIYKKDREYKQVIKNQYDMSFYELVGCVENVETLLAKSLISTSSEHGTETLTEIWKDANLAQVYLAQIPLNNDELSYTSKFLNQVGDYAYSLSRSTIKGESLSQEDLDNLELLYDHSYQLLEILNQISYDLSNEDVSWGDLTKENTFSFAQQVSNISKDSFASIDKNLEEYEGLIYDGAFSEHITSVEKKGLTGDEIQNEEQAKQKVIEFIGQDRVKELNYTGFSEGDIPTYNFEGKINGTESAFYIDITKTGGHVLFMTIVREVKEEKISEQEAVNIGLNFLKEKGYPTMKETYYLKENGALTVNFAYLQDNVTVYPDLIKVKIALDNGEILGIEERGYLNSHYTRDFKEAKITIEQAKQTLNQELEIMSEGLALIPTEWKTEELCYEFKGKVKDREFLVYINVETGAEQDIKMIINTPNGTLTM